MIDEAIDNISIPVPKGRFHAPALHLDDSEHKPTYEQEADNRPEAEANQDIMLPFLRREFARKPSKDASHTTKDVF